MEEKSFTLKELCQTADVTERTVRYYIKEGLLPPPAGSGPYSRYTQEHLLRLRFIRRLKEEFLPLSEIKSLLEGKSWAELQTLARQSGLLDNQSGSKTSLSQALQPGRPFLRQQLQTPPPVGGLPTPVMRLPGLTSPRPSRLIFQPPSFQPDEEESDGAGLGDSWERVELAPGVELNVRSEVVRQKRAELEKLLDEARRLLGE